MKAESNSSNMYQEQPIANNSKEYNTGKVCSDTFQRNTLLVLRRETRINHPSYGFLLGNPLPVHSRNLRTRCLSLLIADAAIATVPRSEVPGVRHNALPVTLVVPPLALVHVTLCLESTKGSGIPLPAATWEKHDGQSPNGRDKAL